MTLDNSTEVVQTNVNAKLHCAWGGYSAYIPRGGGKSVAGVMGRGTQRPLAVRPNTKCSYNDCRLIAGARHTFTIILICDFPYPI